MTVFNKFFRFSASALTLCALPALAQSADIPLGAEVFPENIASAENGDLFVSSITQESVYRVPQGAETAEIWLQDIAPRVTGVYAKDGDVYVCANIGFASEGAFLKIYDQASATQKAEYKLPEGGSCSDVVKSETGDIYIAQLGQIGRVVKISNNEMTTVIEDEALAGLDGLSFVDGQLIVNNLRSGDLYRLNLEQSPVTYTTLTLSRPLEGPDGMRTTEDGTALLIAEARSDRIALAKIDGDNVSIETIATGYEGRPTGVAQIGNTIYVVEGHFQAMAQDSDQKAPETFVIKSFELPK